MQNSLRIALIFLIAAGVLAGSLAQQPPSTKTPGAGLSQSDTPSRSAGTAPKTPPTAGKAKPPLTLKTQKDKTSYAMGMNIGSGLRKQSIDIDPAIMARGLRDGFSNGKKFVKQKG